MKLLERQIAAALARLHHEDFGPDHRCRWHYDGRRDRYWCQHIELTGHDVIGEVERRNVFSLRQED